MKNEAISLPLISIIMPAFNAEKYIESSLHSALNQTYKNIEVLVVDDGSDDRTAVIVNKIATKDQRVKYFFQSNQGPANAKNLGIQYFNGKYALFLDSDDQLETNAIELLVNSLHNEESTIAIFSFDRITNSGIVIASSIISNTNIDEVYTSAWNKIYSYDILKQLRFPTNTFFEDVAFSAMAIILSTNVKLVSSKKPIYHYRQHIKSLTKSSLPITRHLDIIQDFNDMILFVENNNIKLNDKRKSEIDRLINTQIFSHAYLVSKMDEPRHNKKAVIKKLLDFQSKVSIDKSAYSRNKFINIKQMLIMFLLKINCYKVAALVGYVSNKVRKRKYVKMKEQL